MNSRESKNLKIYKQSSMYWMYIVTTFMHPKFTFVFPVVWCISSIKNDRIVNKQETSTSNMANFWCCFSYWCFYTIHV